MSQLFDKQKSDCFSKVDLSRKGSIDEPIVEIINYINNHQDYFSLSSCSGRIIVFAEGSAQDKEEDDNDVEKQSGIKVVKAGCDWIHVSHTPVDPKEVIEKINSRLGSPGCVVVKFEPFILHVQCRDQQSAKLMHTAAVEAGYRNSGLVLGKAGKIVSAVRSTHGLEVPLSNEEGNLLVSEEYIKYILDKANRKLQENFLRIEKFEEKIKLHLCKDSLNKLKDGKPKRKIQPETDRKPKEKSSKEIIQETEDLGELFSDL